MGAEFYLYSSQHKKTPLEALNELRAHVFASGEFNGAHLNPRSVEEAVRLTEPEGTQSILDISRISESPDYFAASPFTDEELQEYFGSTTPALEDVKAHHSAAADSIGRGTARYLVVYDQTGKPSHYVFMGYSFD